MTNSTVHRAQITPRNRFACPLAGCLVLLLAACGGSGSGSADDDNAGGSGSQGVLSKAAGRELAVRVLETQDAVLFSLNTLYEELRVLSDNSSAPCNGGGTRELTTDDAGDTTGYRFVNCRMTVMPDVQLNGSAQLAGPLRLADDASATLTLSGLRLRSADVEVTLEGELQRTQTGALISAQAPGIVAVSHGTGNAADWQLEGVSATIDQRAFVASQQLSYRASTRIGGDDHVVNVGGTVQGASPGCPVAGNWQVDIDTTDRLVVTGGEGANLLLENGGASDTLGCSELALLTSVEAVAPPPPPGSAQ